MTVFRVFFKGPIPYGLGSGSSGGGGTDDEPPGEGREPNWEMILSLLIIAGAFLLVLLVLS